MIELETMQLKDVPIRGLCIFQYLNTYFLIVRLPKFSRFIDILTIGVWHDREQSDGCVKWLEESEKVAYTGVILPVRDE